VEPVPIVYNNVIMQISLLQEKLPAQPMFNTTYLEK
jgi:hypothetical protein